MYLTIDCTVNWRLKMVKIEVKIDDFTPIPGIDGYFVSKPARLPKVTFCAY